MDPWVFAANFLTPYPGNTVIYSAPMASISPYTPSSPSDNIPKVYVDGEVVDSISGLRALPKSRNSKVVTRGYYAPNDGGSGFYYQDANDTTTADNGGTVIVATDGARWKLAYSKAVGARQFGAKGDGVTNDAPAIQAAIDALGAAGGQVVIDSGRFYLGATLSIRGNVTLRGPHANVGSPMNDTLAPYGQVGGALLLNSAFSISMVGGSASLEGLLIHRYGMTFPAADTAGYAGDAVIATNLNDMCVKNCMILGFNRAIYFQGCRRMRLTDINIDCLNGVRTDLTYDVGYLTNIQCWPFATKTAVSPPSSDARSGAAFYFFNEDDLGKITNCHSRGYANGFVFYGASGKTLQNCSHEGLGTGYGFQLAAYLGGGALNNTLIGCRATNVEKGYYINIPANGSAKLLGCEVTGSTAQGIYITSGDVIITGGAILSTASYGIYVANASSKVFVDRMRFYDFTGGGSFKPIVAGVVTTNIKVGENNDYGNVTGPVAGSYYAPSLATAEPLVLPPVGAFFNLTGNTNFSIVSGGWAGRRVTLKFSDHLTVSSSNSMTLNSTMYTSSADTLSLFHDGNKWIETARTVALTAPVALASASPMVLPGYGSLFTISGAVNFDTLNGGWAGRRVTLEFLGVLTVTDGASMVLKGNFTTAAYSTLSLVHDGTSWVEISRSTN